MKKAKKSPAIKCTYAGIEDIPKHKPDGHKEWEMLIDFIYEYAEKNEQFLELSQICRNIPFSAQRLRKWADAGHHDYFTNKMAQLEEMLWNRQRALVMEKDPVQLIMKRMHLNDPQEREWQREKWAKDKAGTGTVTVVMETYPESDIVPKRNQSNF
jgi:histone acetyltransferase (RNA polymerase elongator complex component)